MNDELKRILEDLCIFDAEHYNIDSLRIELEDMLEKSMENVSSYVGVNRVDDDIIITSQENNLHHTILKAYSLFMEYYNSQLNIKRK